jgi:dTDP-L-rhamnose 4-epimerase
VAAIFSSRLLNGQPPVIFEDGLQSRDFVHVSDIVQALVLALDRTDVADVALNVGTGRPTSVAAIARGLAEGLGVRVAPQLVGKFREGDIRHCVGDVQRIKRTLGFVPRVALEDGLKELVHWSRGEQAVDHVAHARAELERKGLIR